MFRRIMRVVLSKTFAFAVLALLQIGLYIAMFFWLAGLGGYAYTAMTVLAVLVLVGVMERDELNPAYKMMWLCIIVLIPLAGLAFYLLWGHRMVPRRKLRLFKDIEHRANAALRQDSAVMEVLKQYDTHMYHAAQYLINYACCPVYPSQGEEYYPLGKDFFPRFLEEVDAAKQYIFLEYYIYETGWMLETTIEHLAKKAAEGVDVRVLYDGFGSLFTLPKGFAQRLRKLGIQCEAFAPLELTIHISDYGMLNHRDHRKITAIDGKVAFSGGLNFADEYINRKERFGEWKDTAFMVRGEPAYSMAVTFLRMWDFVTGVPSVFDRYRPANPLPAPETISLEQGMVQPYWDSPLDGENVAENVYLNIIRSATEYVYISTPYLILDHEMVTSLTLAAKCGVDVRILTPGIPDKPKVFLVTQSYYKVLLDGGVRIFEYTPGFNHAKMYVSDDHIAVVGSANMDYRSLYLHFENCTAFYGGEVVQATKKDMLQSFEKAQEIHLRDIHRLPPWRRLTQIVARFLGPML